ncbi:MAG: MCE family protein, partial [Gammaproteobacteria bacterium]|nr:MCE family protein [Gammaproteobacteria bacterium]
AYLVNKSTRFWNTSGIDISGGLSGIKLRIGSIGSILRGGIAFRTDRSNSQAGVVRNGDIFELYDNVDEASDRGLEIHLAFSSGEGLSVGTSIKHMGIKVGEVKTVRLNQDISGVTVTAMLAITAKQLAVEGSQFWVVKPQVGLTNIANLETIVSGRYIAVKPGGGKRLTDFIGLNAEPTIDINQLGLNIVLKTAYLSSLKPGVKLYYRGFPVGEITGHDLADEADHVRIYANIDQRYQELVRDSSVFWNISGIELSFGLFKGAKLETNTLENIVGGGIAFATPVTIPLAPAARPRTVFELYETAPKNWLEWDTKIPFKNVVIP